MSGRWTGILAGDKRRPVKEEPPKTCVSLTG